MKGRLKVGGKRGLEKEFVVQAGGSFLEWLCRKMVCQDIGTFGSIEIPRVG